MENRPALISKVGTAIAGESSGLNKDLLTYALSVTEACDELKECLSGWLNVLHPTKNNTIVKYRRIMTAENE
ncbi:MAG: hypothetical protein QM762_29930 [Chryseolinea sp.]